MRRPKILDRCFVDFKRKRVLEFADVNRQALVRVWEFQDFADHVCRIEDLAYFEADKYFYDDDDPINIIDGYVVVE
jgi:hypothetical protein